MRRESQHSSKMPFDFWTFENWLLCIACPRSVSAFDETQFCFYESEQVFLLTQSFYAHFRRNHAWSDICRHYKWCIVYLEYLSIHKLFCSFLCICRLLLIDGPMWVAVVAKHSDLSRFERIIHLFHYAVPLEHKTIKREHFNRLIIGGALMAIWQLSAFYRFLTFYRWYSSTPYYLSLVLSDFPVVLISSTLFTIISYMMTNQPLEMFRFMNFILISAMSSFSAQAHGILFGALFDLNVCESLNLVVLFQISSINNKNLIWNIF